MDETIDDQLGLNQPVGATVFDIPAINKDDYPDVMLDIETTGTDFADCAIIEIGAVRCNVRERTVGHDFFRASLLIPTTKFWQEGGRSFWMKKKEQFAAIMATAEEPEKVMRDLIDWCGGQRTLWAKPSHFEYPFLEAYFKRYELQNPFFYRNVNDMNSFFRGMYYPDTPPDFERQLPFSGAMHCALPDALHQLKVVFHTIEDALKKRSDLNVQNIVDAVPEVPAPTAE